MLTEDMIKYLENPQQLNEYSLSELRALLRKYPYFHTAHVLFLLNLKNINDPRYREFLKQSAVYIKDRDKFLRLVNQLEDTPQGTREKQPPEKDRASKESHIDQNKKQTTHTASLGNASEEPAEATAEEEPGEASPEKDQSHDSTGEDQTGKASEGRKDKDFSTEYLRSRIAETLSEQKGDAGEQDKESPELGSDFFIIDKVTQVEEKMARRLREKYQNESRKKHESREQHQEESDLFELDSSAGTEQVQEDTDQPEDTSAEQETTNHEHPPSTPKREVFNFGGEYFSEQEYRRNQDMARKQQNDLIEQFIRKAPELESITPSEKANQDISEESVQEKEDLASEKLIQIYVQQGYYEKAIQAYEKLSLKYPEKSDYFAEQIEKLKRYIHKQKK